MSDLKREIEALLRKTEEIWDTQEYGRLKELWDTDDPEPFYLAEEAGDWTVGWDALERYWSPVPGRRVVEAMRVRYSNLRVKPLAADLATAIYHLRFDMKIRGPMPAIGSEARVISTMRKKPDGWRYVCYAEAPLSPIKYVQRLYEKNVSPEFADFHKTIMERDRALFE